MRKIMTLLAVFSMALPAAAQEWTSLESRARAMGGAGVAMVEGADASAMNPANLALGSEEPFEFFRLIKIKEEVVSQGKDFTKVSLKDTN